MSLYLPPNIPKIPICPNCDSSTWCTLFPPLLMRVRGHPTSWRTTSWLNFVETDFVAELRGDRLRGCSDFLAIQLRGYLTWKPDFDFVKVGSVADDLLTSAGSCLTSFTSRSSKRGRKLPLSNVLDGVADERFTEPCNVFTDCTTPATDDYYHG